LIDDKSSACFSALFAVFRCVLKIGTFFTLVLLLCWESWSLTPTKKTPGGLCKKPVGNDLPIWHASVALFILDVISVTCVGYCLWVSKVVGVSFAPCF